MTTLLGFQVTDLYKIGVGKAGSFHDRGLRASPQIFVGVNGNGDDGGFAGFLMNVMTTLGASENPAVTLENLAHGLAGDGLHTSTSVNSPSWSIAFSSLATSSQPSMAS